ncbi:MAG: bifunctional (p)ppGpp synthetase/guanosine-3',5'-bis(diphosphate) 3'-pyrophosphohydrolase [Alphaproteobacteria bacterium]|nr:bifunctional (p)ppGpp synthetase/guanosine-3',5'-bis(diphosphate) 3'-pyrophosphohydrolase [Alphaproteobacteria bacterium]
MTASEGVRLAAAFAFAARAHVDQRRKGARQEPYLNHLAEVADLAARASGGADIDLIIAALLHDAVEDTPVTPAELEAAFGPRVAALVAEVTDDKTLSESERKRAQVAHAATLSPEARILKLADKISNVRDMAHSPPSGWSVARRAAYLAWAREVVEVCRPASPVLGELFDAIAAEASRGLEA